MLIIPIYCVNRNNTSNNIQLDDVRIKEENRKRLAIMVKESDNEDYKSYNGNTWPEEYDFNKAECYDNTGNLASDVEVTYEDGKITVNTNKTVYCTLYFDKIVIFTVNELIDTNSKGQIQESPIEGDTLRRFQGTNEEVLNNYICFGTNDKETCTSTDGQSKYMYRIMGIDTTTNQLKIIKKEALDTAYQWHNKTVVTWDYSDLKKGLNGTYFLTNTNPIYVLNENISNTSTKWSDVIDSHTWSYGDVNLGSNNNASEVLTMEIKSTSIVDAKIGLMYISDYYLAKGNDVKCGSSSDGCNTKNWLHLSQNDSNSPLSYEWTMARYSNNTGWYIYTDGHVAYHDLVASAAVRPVFYLKSQIAIEGDGSIANPYRIVDTAPTIEKVEVTNDSQNKFTVEVTASENATKYCYKLDTEQDYKCTNSNTNEFSNVDSDTNYIISMYVENKIGLKSDLRNTPRIPIGNKVVENTNHGNGGYGPSGASEVTDPLVERFYGEDPNNYICFGASKCSNNDDHMYRIIGATNDGKLKIIKQTRLNNNFNWSLKTKATWETSTLRSNINGNLFYNDSSLLPIDWKQYIYQTPQWCIGDVVGNYSRGSDVLNDEMTNCKEIESSPISLAYLSDYYFAHKYGKGVNSCLFSPYCGSWLTLEEYEWTMSRDNQNNAWAIISDGGAINATMNYFAYAVRPVFYLIPNITLSGSGSPTDPFIITGLAS